MADFKTRIDDLTGFASTDDVAIVDWLTAGAREIIDVLPMSKLERMSEVEEFTGNTPVEDKKILDVLRKDENNSNILMPCREIDAKQSGRAVDSNYMEFATSSDPVYYLENKRLYTLPASAATDDSKLVKINEDFTILATDTSIQNFPKEATNAVVLYASRNALMRLMNAKHGNADITTGLTAINTEMDETQAVADLINTQVDAAITEIAEMAINVDANVDTALAAMKTAADKINTAIGLANDEYDEVAVEVTGTATSPISAARSAAVSALSISDLTISSSAPSAPSLGTVSYSAATNADASAAAVSAITVDTVAKADISGDVPSYTKPTQNFDITQFETFLETDEDIELAQLQLGRLNNELGEYQADIQNELNKFNQLNQRYEANVQAELTKHNSDLQKALRQAEIDAADARQEAQQATQVDLANKAADQALALQNAAQTMAATIANNDDLVAKFLQEINLYQNNINKEIQEYSQNLQQKIAEYQSAIAIQQSYYQEAQARINAGNSFLAEAQARANEVNTYGAEVASRLGQVSAQGNVAGSYIAAAQGYATEIQSKIGIVQGYGTEINLRLAVDTTEYTWYERQYAQLDAQFKEALQLISVDKVESEIIKDGREAR
jgi:hypothetical protein